MSIAGILTAAGSSQRFGQPKLLLPLGTQPVLAWAAQALRHPKITSYWITIPESLAAEFQPVLAEYLPEFIPVIGGETRAQSIQNAIKEIEKINKYTKIVIHDAARPLAPRTVVESLVIALETYKAAVPGLVLADTIKQINTQGEVLKTIPRETLRAIQTPQGFHLNTLSLAYNTLSPDQIAAATDEAALIEQLGHPIKVIPGSSKALKLTHPEDLARLSQWL